ncbi:MAG: DUF6340 family protein [Candidatus Azobacteroides sp.]|nr:DUF6340 family protein [Candidatus Azobacteroides sp.]
MPARIVFPLDINNVMVVNNAGFQPAGVGHVVDVDGQKETFEAPVSEPSTLMCRSLWEYLENQNFFSGIDFYNIPLKNDTNYLSVQPLSQNKVKEMIEQTGTDAVISLDFFRINSTLAVGKYTEYGIYRATYDVNTQMTVGIYAPGENRKSLSLSDSIFWESFGTDVNDAVKKLPFIDEALTTAVERAGEIAGKALVPHIQVENRKLYISSSGDLKKAYDSVKKDDWDSASSIWTTAYEKSKSLRLRARCAANIALAYELQDDYTQAAEWATQARKEFSASGLRSDAAEAQDLKYYIDRLKQRNAEKILLDAQE